MDYLQKVESLVDAVNHLAKFDVSALTVVRGPARVPEVNELRSELKLLGLKSLEYFAEGLDCIEYAQAPRAAIVMGWTGYIDLLQKKISDDSFGALNAILKLSFHGVYKKCSQIKSIDDLIKYFDDALLLEAGRKLGYLQPHEFKQLDAMRDERNNCAHVQEYAVTPRIALGFYAHLIRFIPSIL